MGGSHVALKRAPTESHKGPTAGAKNGDAPSGAWKEGETMKDHEANVGNRRGGESEKELG